MENKKAFGEYILQKRKQLNLTQKDLANRLFISESAVSKWERGLSYPDITLIRPLCGALSITEHELLTASEDPSFHTMENLAAKYQKVKKVYHWVVAILLGISLITVFIVNLATEQRLSWFFVVVAAELVAASLLLLPTLFAENKRLVALIGFTLSLEILFFVVNLYTQGNWFFLASAAFILGLSLLFLPFVLRYIPFPENMGKYQVLIYFLINTLLIFAVVCLSIFQSGQTDRLIQALLITTISLILPWSVMVMHCYIPIHGDLKKSFYFGIFGVFVFYMNGVIERITSTTSNASYFWNSVISVVLFIGMIIFLIKYIFFSFKKDLAK